MLKEWIIRQFAPDNHWLHEISNIKASNTQLYDGIRASIREIMPFVLKWYLSEHNKYVQYMWIESGGLMNYY